LNYFYNDGNGNVANIVKTHFNGDKELLAMDFDSLTLDNMEQLQKRLSTKIIPKLEKYTNLSPTQLWDEELQTFLNVWELYQNHLEEFKDEKELVRYVRSVEKESQTNKPKRSLEQCLGNTSDQLIPDSKKYKK